MCRDVPRVRGWTQCLIGRIDHDDQEDDDG